MSRTLTALITLVVLGMACGPTPKRVSAQDQNQAALKYRVQLNACENGAEILGYHSLPSCDHGTDGFHPPSKVLEEAKLLFDRQDYAQAIEKFNQVIKGETAEYDDGCNQQKARFFRAKAFYQIGHYDASYYDFVLFVREVPGNMYFCPAVIWLTYLRDKIAPGVVDRCLARFSNTSDCLITKRLR